ncbi:MAG TPA: bifunctional 5,10-methylenetetrahydrofolate dehydrogenase/5,10-methenyltetrahydrofolate cyclohydrolase [Ktedonobacterales bacterium]|jgi:methylenetetrahydrofolate dehydrogenase (NADP+)/methenyltetrahydrofolate cyclohydrolase
MVATILHGRALAETLRERLTEEAARYAHVYGRRATLALVSAGHDPTAALYAGQVARSCQRIGLDCQMRSFDDDVAEAALRETVARLGERDDIQGVVVLLPLPPHIRQRVVTEALAPEKDIDGLGPRNAGRLLHGLASYVPSTADAARELLRDAGIALKGKTAVVVGRSNVGGKPAALLFLRARATVTICHSRTPDLAALTRRADVLFASTGRPGSITADMVKPGAVVLDAGMNAVAGRVVGDVDFEGVAEVAEAITPVPGGLGPLTNLVLIRHALLGPS